MNAVAQNITRERLIFRYLNALEHGDLETIGTILSEAEKDTNLERLILEVNEIYILEQQNATDAQSDALVRELVFSHLPSGDPDQLEAELPPLTVADVAARISSDATLKGLLEREPIADMLQLQRLTNPLPTDLTLRSVRQLFSQLEIRVSRSFEKLFRETAIYLSLGHEQTRAQLAATRRPRQKRRNESVDKRQPENKPDEL